MQGIIFIHRNSKAYSTNDEARIPSTTKNNASKKQQQKLDGAIVGPESMNNDDADHDVEEEKEDNIGIHDVLCLGYCRCPSSGVRDEVSPSTAAATRIQCINVENKNFSSFSFLSSWYPYSHPLFPSRQY